MSGLAGCPRGALALAGRQLQDRGPLPARSRG